MFGAIKQHVIKHPVFWVAVGLCVVCPLIFQPPKKAPLDYSKPVYSTDGMYNCPVSLLSDPGANSHLARVFSPYSGKDLEHQRQDAAELGCQILLGGMRFDSAEPGTSLQIQNGKNTYTVPIAVLNKDYFALVWQLTNDAPKTTPEPTVVNTPAPQYHGPEPAVSTNQAAARPPSDTRQGGGDKEVRIAFMDCLSGSNADASQQDLNGAQLAVDDINAAGGIKSLNGAKVKLVVVDITSDPKNASSTAERAFSTEKVIAVKGSGISAMALPTLPIAEKAKIPIVLNSLNDQITSQGYKYTFQVSPHGSQFGNTQVEFLKWLKYKLGVKDVAVVYENSGYGVSTAGGIKDIAAKAGLNLVLYEAYPHGFTDASSLVTKIKASKAQALFPVAYTTDAKLILSTMKQMNVAPVIIGGGAGFLWPAFYTELGPGINGFVSVASWNWDSKNISSIPERAAITERYEKRFNTYMTERAGPSYVAIRMIAEAIEKAKSTDSEKVREQLATFNDSGTVGGMMQPGVTKIDATGWNSVVHPIMIQWQDNKPRTIFPETDSVRQFKPAK